MTKVEVTKAKAFEIDTTKKYILAFDKHSMTMHDAEQVGKIIKKWGIEDSVLIGLERVDGMKIIEIKDEENKQA